MRSVTTKHNRQTALLASQGSGSNQSPSPAQQSPAAGSNPPESVTWFRVQRASNAEIWNFTLILLKYHYGRGVTSIPRKASICFSCQIALSSVAELLAWSICRRSAFSAGSLSLIVHRHTNTLASWRLAIRTVWCAPGKLASKQFVCGRSMCRPLIFS
jgi:hypothetical protein